MASWKCRLFKTLFFFIIIGNTYFFLYKGITITFKSNPYENYEPKMFINKLYSSSNNNNNNAQCSEIFQDFNHENGFNIFKINYNLLKGFYIFFLILLFISNFILQMKYYLEQYLFDKNSDFNRVRITFRKLQFIYYPLRFLAFIDFFILFILFILSDISKFKSFMKCGQIETIKIEESLKTIVDLYYIMYVGLIFMGITLIFDIIEFFWGNKLIQSHQKYLNLANNLSIEVTVQH